MIVLEKIEKCRKDLNWWNKNVFGSVRKELERLRKILPKAKNAAMVSENNDRVRQIKKEIKVLLVEKKPCGHKDQDYFGQSKGTEIQNIFIAVLRKDIEKI